MTAEIKKRRFAEGIEVENPTDLALKFEVLAADPSGTEGDVYYNSVTKAPKVYNGSVWGALGGGAGGGVTNLNSNPNAASGIDLSATNDVGDYIDVGGVGVVASSVTSGHPLDPVFASGVQLTFNDDSAAAEYTRLRFRVPPGSRNTKLAYFHYQLASSYVTQTAMIELYNYSDAYSSDEARVVLSTDDSTPETLIPNYDGQFKFNFDADDREYYELRYVNNGATAGTLTLNEVTITPSLSVVSGEASTPEETFTPTGSWTTNTTYVGAKWRHQNRLYVRAQVILAGAPNSTQFFFNLPSGLTIDTTSLSGSDNESLGFAWLNDSGTAANRVFAVVRPDSSSDQLVRLVASGSSNVTQAVPFTFASGDEIDLFFSVPIAEWSGGAYYGSNDVEYAYNSDAGTSSDTTSFAYGPSGGTTPAALSGSISKRVRFRTPIQPTDKIYVEVDYGNEGLFMPIGANNDADLTLMTRQGSIRYGMAWKPVTSSDTDVDVEFGQYAGPGSTYGGAGSAWSTSTAKWRVVKEKAGAASGFGLATATQSGLVKKNQYQTKYLQADKTSAGTMSDLTYALETGATYRITAVMRIIVDDTDGRGEVQIFDNATQIGLMRNNIVLTDSADSAEFTRTWSTIYTMTSTSLTFYADSVSANAYIDAGGGSSDPLGSFVTVEKLENYESTSDW
jgi:hypothetical protein